MLDPELNTFTYSIKNYSEIIFQVKLLQADSGDSNSFVEEFLRIKPHPKTFFSRLAKAHRAKISPELGRHFGTYCLVRTFQPKMVIEAGIKDGVGSLVLSQAQRNNCLSLNVKDFAYLGIDPSKKAGHLNDFGGNSTLTISDSDSFLQSWADQDKKIDRVMFISDSIPGIQIQNDLVNISKIVTRELLFIYNYKWIDSLQTPEGFQLKKKVEIADSSNHAFYQGRTIVAVVYQKTTG
jgi:hypothetical protein